MNGASCCAGGWATEVSTGLPTRSPLLCVGCRGSTVNCSRPLQAAPARRCALAGVHQGSPEGASA
eukprot:11764680-Alexandrium_andersonii.AAC.1